MPLEMFAGLYVGDFDAAVAWYTRLLGASPSWLAPDSEAVWELAEHRSLAIEHQPSRAGHGILTVFVDDFDDRVDQIARRGIDPIRRLTYGNGVRKALYHDPDGNEIGFGGGPIAVDS